MLRKVGGGSDSRREAELHTMRAQCGSSKLHHKPQSEAAATAAMLRETRNSWSAIRAAAQQLDAI